jgi:hypothetical protein
VVLGVGSVVLGVGSVVLGVGSVVAGVGSVAAAPVVVSSGIDESFARCAYVVGRTRGTIGFERLLPRAVALDPLMGSEHPVLTGADCGRCETSQRTDQLGGANAPGLRGHLGFDDVVAKLEAPESRPEVFDDGSALARRLDRKVFGTHGLLDRRVEHGERQAGWSEVVLDARDRFLERRRAGHECDGTDHLDANGQRLGQRGRERFDGDRFGELQIQVLAVALVTHTERKPEAHLGSG